jgi:hypothetical protein
MHWLRFSTTSNINTLGWQRRYFVYRQQSHVKKVFVRTALKETFTFSGTQSLLLMNMI